MAFALLAFVGQSVAAVNVSCSMMADGSTSSIMEDLGGMDHPAHTTHELSNSNQSAVACCADELCSMTNCLWSPTFSVTTTSQSNPYAGGVLNTRHSFSYLDPESRSLFRPPISH
ncbi:MAG: hypothetical protein OXC05_01705 [Halieaceae bacterium]|nr:hypothetical protein [Halieaceae bacterium]